MQIMYFGAQVCIFVQLWIAVCYSKLKNADDEIMKFDNFNKNQDIVYADITVENTLNALEKIAFYYYKHKKDVSVDFAFGMRVAEGKAFRFSLSFGTILIYLSRYLDQETVK